MCVCVTGGKHIDNKLLMFFLLALNRDVAFVMWLSSSGGEVIKIARSFGIMKFNVKSHTAHTNGSIFVSVLGKRLYNTQLRKRNS